MSETLRYFVRRSWRQENNCVISVNSMKKTVKEATEKLINGFRNLPAKRKRQVFDFVESENKSDNMNY